MFTHISKCPNIMTSKCKVIYKERSTGICLVGKTKAYYLGKAMLYYRSLCTHALILKPDAKSFPDAAVWDILC